MKLLVKLKSIIIMVVFTGLFGCTNNCKSQVNNFKYKSIPKKYLIPFDNLSPYRQKAENFRKSAYDLTQSLPADFVKDGSVDYTSYLQFGINQNKIVVFPDFPILINEKGLVLTSNSVVVFQKKSKMIMKPNKMQAYQIMKILNVTNVVVYFPVIQGDRNKHLGAKGEWGMGISIGGASNIEVINPRISNCWGDGIYIGDLGKSNKNIKIYYAQLDNNRRNGISIISVDGLLVKSAVISNTYGTSPMSGIDIEPNNYNNEIKNIIIESPVTFNNGDHGIVLSLSRLGIDKNQNVGINIKNHLDDNSSIGFGLWLSNGVGTSKTSWAGQIEVSNASWKNNSKAAFLNYAGKTNGLNLLMKNLNIYKKDAKGLEYRDNKSVENLKVLLKKEYSAIVR